MGADKPIPVLILPHVMFIGGLTRHGRKGNIQGSWDPERSVYVISTVGILVEEALASIRIRTRNVVIHMECDGEASWVKPLGEIWTTQSVDQWVDWLTSPSSGE